MINTLSQKFSGQFLRQSRYNRRSRVDPYYINTDQLAKPAVVDSSELSPQKSPHKLLRQCISVTILTKNCQETLGTTLESLKKFSEVLVYDSGSTDRTLEIAASYPNVKIVKGIFMGFGPTHNTASSQAKFDWILSIDSDEVLTSELSAEILQLQLNPSCVYQIERKNYYNGKWVRWGGGWYPDPVLRLYHRKSTCFSDHAVHEKLLCEGLQIYPLVSPLLHTPYRSMEDFLHKMQTYSTLFAQQNKGKKSASIFKAVAHGLFAFLKSYLLKRGFLGGKEGFIISTYNGHTAFYKYLKLTEVNRKR